MQRTWGRAAATELHRCGQPAEAVLCFVIACMCVRKAPLHFCFAPPPPLPVQLTAASCCSCFFSSLCMLSFFSLSPLPLHSIFFPPYLPCSSVWP